MLESAVTFHGLLCFSFFQSFTGFVQVRNTPYICVTFGGKPVPGQGEGFPPSVMTVPPHQGGAACLPVLLFDGGFRLLQSFGTGGDGEPARSASALHHGHGAAFPCLAYGGGVGGAVRQVGTAGG